jgi:GAF domain-containing protein
VEYPLEFVEALLALSRASVTDGDLESLLDDVAQLAVAQLRDCDMAGVTLIGARGPTTAVFTNPAAPEIDSAQYETGRGPCLDAFRDGEIMRIEDTKLDERWPEFAAAALEHDVRSTLSLPLRTETETIGALNLYSNRLEAFGDDDQVATVFVAHAASTLANAQAYHAAHALSEQLQEALASRAVIEQAKGMIMREQGCDADAAFERLKRESQNTNRKLRDVAQTLVDGATSAPRDQR